MIQWLNTGITLTVGITVRFFKIYLSVYFKRFQGRSGYAPDGFMVFQKRSWGFRVFQGGFQVVPGVPKRFQRCSRGDPGDFRRLKGFYGRSEDF